MGYKIPHKLIKVAKPTYDELARLKATHNNMPFDAILLHLVLEHDIAQDAREAKGRARDGKQLFPESMVFRYVSDKEDGDALLKEAIEVEAGLAKLLTINGYKPNLKQGRPKGAKDLSPRIRRKKLPFGEAKR